MISFQSASHDVLAFLYGLTRNLFNKCDRFYNLKNVPRALTAVKTYDSVKQCRHPHFAYNMEMVKKGPGEACANNYPPQTTFFHGTLNKATVHTVCTSQHQQAWSTTTLAILFLLSHAGRCSRKWASGM